MIENENSVKELPKQNSKGLFNMEKDFKQVYVV